jgi:hypothetical protein
MRFRFPRFKLAFALSGWERCDAQKITDSFLSDDQNDNFWGNGQTFSVIDQHIESSTRRPVQFRQQELPLILAGFSISLLSMA